MNPTVGSVGVRVIIDSLLPSSVVLTGATVQFLLVDTHGAEKLVTAIWGPAIAPANGRAPAVLASQAYYDTLVGDLGPSPGTWTARMVVTFADGTTVNGGITSFPIDP